MRISPPLSDSASDCFTFFPLILSGYRGYTDYNAMNSDMNNDLLGRSADQQYLLAGFARGFLDGIHDRMSDDRRTRKHTIRAIWASVAEREYIGWLARLQRIGTDNAGSSTANLYLVVRVITGEILKNGPISIESWTKVRYKTDESPENSGTSPEALAKLTDIYRQAHEHGKRVASSAVISAADDGGAKAAPV